MPTCNFTFRQVQVFLEVCRLGNFRGAADRLDISQPAISNIIRSLESQLGVLLFERRRGAVCVLSQEGVAFRDSAEQFAARCEQISHLQRKRPKPLNVFVGAHLLEDFLRPRLSELYEAHPELQLNVLPERNRDQILHDITEEKVDIVLITVPANERPRGSQLISPVSVGIYGARNFWDCRSAEELSALPFILPAAGGQLTTSMLRDLESHGVRPSRIAGHFPYHDLRVRLACHGMGVLFVVQSLVERHDELGQLRLLFPMTPWERRLYINPRVNRSIAAAVTQFISNALNRGASSRRPVTHHSQVMRV
jgi:DNA-binding transcriptional LysR family regulator